MGLAQYLTILLLVVACAAQPRPDPYANPKDDIYNPLRYIPSDTLTSIGLSVMLLTSVALAWNTWKHGGKYMLCMVISGFLFSFGVGLRYLFARDPHSIGKYVAQHLLIVLSPCGFIAADYILLGRIAGHLNAGNFLYISQQRVTTVFVVSDVITFLIQAGGGGLSTGQNQTLRNLGEKVFLGGLILQLLSFIFFTLLFISFIYRIRKDAPRIWHADEGKPWSRDWRTLAAALSVSCLGVLIRSCFRTAELAEGWGSHLARVESYFYTLDMLPLFIAIAVYVPFWPGKYIDGKSSTLVGDAEDASRKFPSNGPSPLVSQDGMELGTVRNSGRGAV